MEREIVDRDSEFGKFQALPVPRRELRRGDSLGRYEIVSRIGTGGFGNVYRAWDPLMRREVALKTCETWQESARERLAREARLAGGLDHPNIVRIYDIQDGDGLCFMVQEFLSGEDLASRLSRPEPIAFREKLRILDEIACGLGHAHARGIVHADVKPANIRLLPDGRVKILDFGIAELLDADGVTRSGATIGSLGYMAPEQIDGGEIDRRTDLFALGIVAYELLGGWRPFEGEGVSELFERILCDEPEPLSAFVPGFPVELDALILRCLEKDSARRPACADEFRRELGAVRDGGAIN
jgi:eukaryotic-like serine/threonine-protein kinase